uniref:Protein EFR3 homolog cmp44E n=1 Tax=Cacopsylla melanoneura TaxID=428564 RepID=A0A8D8WYC0_9HEMI
MCLNCFSTFRPRYKRLVDNIFPLSPEEGLVKTNMEKLTFYALSSPEKLDRIGEYLYQRASRDIARRRTGYVVIAMEAMDQLLTASCHSQTLNLFVESFLKIVQKLLESPDADLQILATNSFVRFSNIKEDTPSYHRRYDFFVSKFSAMCHSAYAEPQKRSKLRLAGIRGIQGVIRKTVSDDLVENIWHSTHMEKIIPSLLFNMQESGHYQSPDLEPDVEETGKMINMQEDPSALAETCLRELMGGASFNHVRNVIQPVLIHFDCHALWNPNVFATHCLRMLMYSVLSQYSHLIVNCILAHLSEHHRTSASIIRAKIADALSKIIAIAAPESIGPTVLEVVQSILMQLKESVVRLPEDEDEKLYQENLIFALGEYAAHLPDYQKTEILVFIISKVLTGSYKGADSTFGDSNLVQNTFMKCLLMVSSKYTSLHMTSAFPLAFLEPLLKILQSQDPEIRLLVNKVIHTLLDRHENLTKLNKPTIHPETLELMIDKPSHTDSTFIKKHAHELYLSISQSLEMDNNCVENYEVVYTTLSLMCIELISDDTVVDFIRVIMNIQDIALTSTTLSDSQRYNLHALVASLFTLVPLVAPLINVRDFVTKTIAARTEHKAFHLLPELRMHYDVKSTLVPLSEAEDIYFNETELGDLLKTTDAESVSSTGHNSFAAHRHSWAENTSVTLASSNSDLNTEVDSSPATPNFVSDARYEELRFESLKRILTENKGKKFEQDRQRLIAEKFKHLTFTDVLKHHTAESDEESLQFRLNEIFDKMETRSKSNSMRVSQPIGKPKYETLFPELFYH